jgi:hypothetical protein
MLVFVTNSENDHDNRQHDRDAEQARKTAPEEDRGSKATKEHDNEKNVQINMGRGHRFSWFGLERTA